MDSKLALGREASIVELREQLALARKAIALRDERLEAAKERISFLSLLQSEDEEGERARRVKVDGQEHIYSSERADGSTVYEVRYLAEDGKRRWKTVGPDLHEAIALRDAERVTTDA